MKIAVVGAAPRAGLDVHGAPRIGRKPLKVIADCRQLEARIALQPLHQPAGVVVVVAVGAAAVVVPVRVQQEKGWMLRIKSAGGDDLVVHLPQHAAVLQGAVAAARVFVADIALGRHGDEGVARAIRIDILHILRPQHRRRDL